MPSIQRHLSTRLALGFALTLGTLLSAACGGGAAMGPAAPTSVKSDGQTAAQPSGPVTSKTDGKTAAQPAGSPAAAGAKGAAPPRALPIRIGVQANTDWLIYMAQAQGLFEKAGLAPEFVKFAQGSAMTAAIQSQSIDVANTGVVPFTAALAQGVPLTAVALSLAVANSEGFVARPESGIQTVADLRGKKISYAKGSTSHLAVLRMLQKENIPISEVTILEMPPAEQLAAFLNKNIDVAEVWEPWQQKMIRQGNGYIVAQEKDLGLKTAFALDAVRTDWLASNQEAAKRFLIALLMARDELRKDPTPALKQVAELMGITEEESAIIYAKDPEPDLYRGVDPSYEWAIAKGGLPSQALADVNDFLAENNVIARKADLSQAIDTGPLEAALKEHPQPQ